MTKEEFQQTILNEIADRRESEPALQETREGSKRDATKASGDSPPCHEAIKRLMIAPALLATK